MLQYVIRRLVMVLPVLLGITAMVFLLMHITPGDPARVALGEHATEEAVAQLRREWGLDDPLAVQYARYVWGALRADLGRSFTHNRPVREELARTFPATLQLAAGGTFFAVAVGVPIGVLSATRPYSLADRLSMVVALLGVSMPVFWTAILLIMTFSIHLRWLPTSGRGGLDHLILPAITVASVSLALLARMTRSAMLDVLQEDYVRTARAKGLGQRLVVYRHALRNALIPVVTVLGQQFGLMLGGAVVTETVFAWPGMGRLIVQAILARDARVVQGAVLLLALTIVVINSLVDVAYGYIDPRIRYE